jgi:hypothetical protein
MEILTDAERTTASVPERLDYILDQIQSLDAKITNLDKKVDPIIEAYDGVLLGRKFLIGVGGFAGSMIALGAAIIWLGSFIKHIFG